uniref:Nonstructural polyprotein n=1 Tax=Perth bee virus 2 TaxID=2201296 RepID=A0A2U8JQB7_9VIRU|nr:nonstructural polyprotein [Perth bee virus 2]
MNFNIALRNRSERQVSLNARVAALVSHAEKSSLKNGTLKMKRKFEDLSKKEKRQWREDLQSRIYKLKSRLSERIWSTARLKGKTLHRWQQMSRSEYTIWTDLDEYDDPPGVQFQTGLFGNAVKAAGVAAAATVVVKTAGHVSHLVDNANNLMTTSSDLLATFSNSVTSFVEKLKEFGHMIWKPCLIALALWILTKYAEVPVFASVVITAVAIYLPEIKCMLEKFLPTAFRFQDGGVSLASDIVTMCMTCWVPGNSAKSVTGEFMKRVSNFPRASDGMESFIKKVISLVEQLINFVTRRTGENRITLKGKMDAYEQWRTEVIERITYFAKHPTAPIQEIRKAKQLQITGLGFHNVMMTFESKRDLNYWLEKLNLALAPHEGAINADNNMRAMPVCIMIGGDSGVGKTTLLRYIASCILMLSKECTVKDALENMWQKGTTEYWNGYIGQKCLVMDDCFQVKPKAGDMDSEAMQFIRGIGNWSMPLNFADLGNKGKIYLDSPLVIGTTNCRNVHAEWASFITEPKALVRRFQTAVWVSVNPEFATADGKFDFDKVNNLFAEKIATVVEEVRSRRHSDGARMTVSEVLDMLPWEVWNLKIHGFDRETISDAPFPGGLRAVIENAADMIVQRKEVNRKEITDITDLLKVLDECMSVDQQTGLRSHEVRTAENALRLARSDTMPLPPDDFANHLDSITPGFENEIQEEEYQMQQIMQELEISHEDAVLRERNISLYESELWDAMREAEKQHESYWAKLKTFVLEWFDHIMSFLGIKSLVDGVAQDGLIKTAALIAAGGAAMAIITKMVNGVIGAICGLFGFVTSFFGMKKPRNEQEDQDESKSKEIKMATFNETGSVSMQVGVPPNEDVYDIIYANTVKCKVGEENVGQFIGLGSDVFIFPKHFVAELQKMSDDTELVFVHAKDNREMKMLVGDFLCLKRIDMPDYDISGVSFGRCFAKSTKTIVKFFLTQHEIKNVLRGGNSSVRLDVATFKKDGTLRQRTLFSPTCYYHGKALDSVTGTTINGLVEYVAPTIAGDCGAPLTLAEARHCDARCILGFHSAGRDSSTGRLGYSTLVSQEVARQMLTNLSTYDDVMGNNDTDFQRISGAERVQLQSDLSDKGLVKGSFELIGVLKKPVNAPSKTKLKPSGMQEQEIFGPCPTAPAVLSAKMVDGELREPMIQGLKAYQTPLLYKDPVQLRPIIDLAMQRHWKATEHFPRDILTFEEAIKAPAGWKLKPINRKTSPGYLWSDYVSPRTPGKTAFFGHDGEYVFDYDDNDALWELKFRVTHTRMCAEEGIREVHLCTDFLKDELRPLKKVQDVATRVISATPVDYTILVRMYFGAYMAAMYDTHVSNGMAPGLNQYTGWAKLANSLKNVGENVFDGDFSRFDASEQPWVHEGILDYINRWYRFNNPNWTQKQEDVRNILWLDLVHSRHICGYGNTYKYVVQWTKSLPSGHPLTTVVNSMYSLITLTGCYVRLTGDVTDMWQHTFINTFGDDNISSVDDEMKDKFNQVTVAGMMREMFDLTYTPGDKSGVLVPYTDLEKCTFLKRGFRIDDTAFNRLTLTGQNFGWVGPLAEESFLYAGYWYKNSRSPAKDLKDRIEFALAELCLHPASKWDEVFPKMQTWCFKNNVSLELTNRESTRDFVSRRMDVWF